jgi:hypothetical protein
VQALTPQTDALTDDELRAAPVEVTGSLSATVELPDTYPLPDDQADSAFKRLLKFEPLPGEELRRDEGQSDDYHGAAADGTATSAAAWRVVRLYKAGGLITRVRYRTGVAWDARSTGWS